jgi:hypothetical protein
MYNLAEWLARDTATGKMPGGVIQPEGMGLVALCQKCNGDLLGTHYVPSFVKFVDAGNDKVAGLAAMTAQRRRRTQTGITAAGRAVCPPGLRG